MKIILVGVGGFSGRWAKVLNKTPGVQLDACVDTNAGNQKQFCRQYGFSQKRCFSSLQVALQESTAPLVIVSVPTQFHYVLARQALMSRRNVLVEKPLTSHAVESARLVKLAKTKKQLLSVVSQYRYSPMLRYFKKACTSGQFGKPLTFSVRIHMNRPRSYYDHPARRTGYGVLAIQGAHAMDWIQWLFGRPKACACAVGTLYHKTNNEDNAFASVTMKNGVMGLFDINHITQAHDEVAFDVCFEKAKLCYSMSEGMIIKKGKRSRPVSLRNIDPQYHCLQRQLRNFVAACEGKTKLDITGQDGLQVMQLLENLYLSANKMALVRQQY